MLIRPNCIRFQETVIVNCFSLIFRCFIFGPVIWRFTSTIKIHSWLMFAVTKRRGLLYHILPPFRSHSTKFYKSMAHVLASDQEIFLLPVSAFCQINHARQVLVFD